MSQGRMLNVQVDCYYLKKSVKNLQFGFDSKDGNLDTNTALIYDAVHLFALALHQVSQIQVISKLVLNRNKN